MWRLTYDDRPDDSYESGIVTFGNGSERKTPFLFSIPDLGSMAMPEHLPWWGTGNHSFSPMLVQLMGNRSLLFTFEHIQDPAFRTTLVIDKTNRIARRRSELGYVVIVTHVTFPHRDEHLQKPLFEPSTDWIRPDY